MTDRRIELQGADWNTADDFYDALLAALGAPEWHGHNLDALWDSLVTGGINDRNPPLRIRIRSCSRMSPDAQRMVERFSKLVEDAQAEGVDLSLETDPD